MKAAHLVLDVPNGLAWSRLTQSPLESQVPSPNPSTAQLSSSESGPSMSFVREMCGAAESSEVAVSDRSSPEDVVVSGCPSAEEVVVSGASSVSLWSHIHCLISSGPTCPSVPTKVALLHLEGTLSLSPSGYYKLSSLLAIFFSRRI